MQSYTPRAVMIAGSLSNKKKHTARVSYNCDLCCIFRVSEAQDQSIWLK